MFKLRPYSLAPGTCALIPKTSLSVEIFPTMVRLEGKELLLPLTGPIRPFTIFQDLELGLIEVTGKAKEGYFRYHIIADSGAIYFRPKRGCLSEELYLADTPAFLPTSTERLFLSKTKQLDLALLKRRCDPAEFLPLWLRLAALTPEEKYEGETRGNFALFQEKKIDFKNAFEAIFVGLFVPRINDNYQGISPYTGAKISPTPLIHEGAEIIRSHFIKWEKDSLTTLPRLPKELHAGFLENSISPEGDLVSIKWSKKRLRKVIIKAAKTRTIALNKQPVDLVKGTTWVSLKQT